MTQWLVGRPFGVKQIHDDGIPARGRGLVWKVQIVLVAGDSTESGSNCSTCSANRMRDGFPLTLNSANPPNPPLAIRRPFCCAVNLLEYPATPKWPTWLSLTGAGAMSRSLPTLNA